MVFTFETSGANTFLVYELQPADSVDQVGLKMMASNRIEGLAPVFFTQLDENRYLKYNISAKVALSDFFVGAVGKKQLLGAFSSILAAVIEAGEYMIATETLLLDPKHIYINVSSCEAAVVALPIEGFSAGVDAGAFFKNIMFGTKFDQTENNDHIGKIVNFLNSNPAFSPEEFKQLVDSMMAKPVVRDLPPPLPKAAPPPAYAPPIYAQPAGYAQAAPSAPQAAPYPAPPPAPQPARAQAPPHAPAAPQEKEMTLVHLLSHYSKENKAIYDAQQARKKAAGSAPKQVPGAGAPAVRFAVPGAPATPAPAPAPVRNMANAPSPAIGQPGAPQEKEMTLMYLMSHYSKENKAVYDAQQAQKKAAAKAQPALSAQYAPPPAQYAPQQQYASPPQPMQPAPAAPRPQPAPAMGIQPGRIAQPAPVNFGETTMLGVQTSGTTILGMDAPEAQRTAAHLIRVKTGERIPITGELFRIGKEKTYADYCIEGNGAISRSHAMIRLRDGDYFISDTNSTNHTYVDGMMLPSNLETKLSHGAKLMFADEEFVFNLY